VILEGDEERKDALAEWMRGLDNVFVFPAFDAALVGRCALILDLTDFDAMAAELQPLIDKVWRHCEDKGSRGRTVTLKVKFNDFEIITRGRSVPVAVSSRADLERLSIALLQNEMPFSKPVRLLGVSLSALQGDEQEEPQLGLPI
jgi:DNA polymerase IV